MTKAESKVIDFIKKHILLFLLVAVTIIAIFLRACGMDFKSDDFNSFLNPWWSIIRLNDFNGLATQVGNYNIPYQVIIYLMTLLQLKSLYAYKIVSIIFDFVLAISTAMLVYSFAKNNRRLKAILTYSAVLLSATVIFNSSFWAQCDSIYTSVYNPCNPVFAQRQADCIVCVHRHCVCIQVANRIHHSRSALLLDYDKENFDSAFLYNPCG